MTEQETLTILRICLERAILPVILIERWAQRRLTKGGVVRDDYMLDLCSASNIGINETVHILKRCESKVENPEIWKTAFGIARTLYDAKEIDLKRACYFVDNVATEMNKTGNEIFGMSLDDAYYLAERKSYGNLKTVEKEFIEITNEHKSSGRDFMMENFKEDGETF